ncbi:MAG: glycosyltransferase [Armatimonadota bacterium]
MNVLVVTNMYPSETRPYLGVFVRDQVEALRAAGVDVDVLHIDNSKKLNYSRAIPELWRRISRKRYDLIHAHYVHCGWIARMQFRLPVVVTSHGSDTLGHEGWFLRLLHPMVDAMTITSRENQKRVGLHDTYLLPCGVDTELFKPQDQREARRELGWAPDRKVMLYVGRDSPLKRLDVLREAHSIVSSRRDDVDLVLATAVPHDQIPVCMNAADVFVFASETEGAPVVIKEAMACNLPIVSVDVGDVRELISDLDQCFICERTPESMAEFVLRVLETDRRSNGRRIAQEFGNDRIAARLIEIYQSVLMKRSHNRLS